MAQTGNPPLSANHKQTASRPLKTVRREMPRQEMPRQEILG
jgi:hypothetical protein